jgi:hypothetical protein
MIPIGANSKTAENLTDISSFDLDLQPSDEEWMSHVAEFADYMAEARGFLPVYELDKWLASEAEEQ